MNRGGSKWNLLGDVKSGSCLFFVRAQWLPCGWFLVVVIFLLTLTPDFFFSWSQHSSNISLLSLSCCPVFTPHVSVEHTFVSPPPFFITLMLLFILLHCEVRSQLGSPLTWQLHVYMRLACARRWLVRVPVIKRGRMPWQRLLTSSTSQLTVCPEAQCRGEIYSWLHCCQLSGGLQLEAYWGVCVDISGMYAGVPLVRGTRGCIWAVNGEAKPKQRRSLLLHFWLL